jgi:protein TonB
MLITFPNVDENQAEPLYATGFARPHAEKMHVAHAADRPLPQRHGYQPPRSSRIFGTLGTAAIIPVVLVVALVTLGHIDRQPAPRLVVSLPVSQASKPEPARAEVHKPVEKQVKPVQDQQMAAVSPPVVSTPLVQTPAIAAPPSPVLPEPVPLTPPAPPQPAAPPPARPTQTQAHHGPDRWEGRVLARLESFRHYPAEAQRARRQGATVLRFRLDRSGHVLSASIERSSGDAALDQAAMETLRRADPLPKIPADRPDQVELVVPIEFSLSR